MRQTPLEQVALFRYQVIAPLLSVEAGSGRLKKVIESLAARDWPIPFSSRTRISAKTIEEWLYRYKRSGLEGLKPQIRSDCGQSKKISGEVAAAIEQMLKAQPSLTGPIVLKELEAKGIIQPGAITLSSFYRFRHEQGLDKTAAQPQSDRRAFSFENPNDCWQSDMMFGPTLALPDGSRAKAYLWAVLDDATRLICHAQFYLEQHMSAFEDCLKQALMKRGVPKRLYVDNAQVFRSRPTLLAAARLGIHLIHTRPHKPEGRGKIERWFRSVRTSFLSRVDPKALTDLNGLNELLWAWIEGEYHQRHHQGIDEPPIDKWIRLSDAIRPLSPSIDLDRLFFAQVSRRVRQDGTFTLKRKLFEAGVQFIGQSIHVLFNPFDLRCVWISSSKHPQELEVFPLDAIANQRVSRLPDPPQPKPQNIRFCSLENLKRLLDLDSPSQDDPEEGDSHGPLPCKA